jgi:predicted phosphoribosyltransferase
MIFKDREDAGKRLAAKLADFDNAKDTIVAGLARGGVVVAAEVARTLDLPLEVIIAKKIGAPDNPELAIGAIAENARLLEEEIVEQYGIPKDYIDTETIKVEEEINRRVKHYRRGEPLLSVNGKTVIIVDDGVATGATMRAAINCARILGAREVVSATPVISSEALQRIEQEADRVVYLQEMKPYFSSVGEHYKHFSQVSDEKVVEALKMA